MSEPETVTSAVAKTAWYASQPRRTTMARHDRAYGRYHSTRQKGRGHKGTRVMHSRREASGMDKAAFEALVRRLGIQAR